MEAGLVRGPYLVIAAIFLVVAFLFWRVHLPEVTEEPAQSRQAHRGTPASSRTGISYAA